MATASSKISPGYTLVGSTPAPGSAPISYQIETPEGTINAGNTSFTLIKPNNSTTIVRFSTGQEVVLSNQQLDSFTAGLNNAWSAVNKTLASQVKVAAPAQPATPTPVTNGLTPEPITTRGTLPGNEIVVTAPKKAVANTADVPLAISRETTSLVPQFEPKTLTQDPQVAANLAKNDPGSLVPQLEPQPVTNTKGAAAAPGTSSKYTVVKGDTLTAIAKKYGVPLADLIKANPQIKNPDLIYPGQVINIPAKPSTPGATPGTDPVKPETGTTAPSAQPPTIGLSGNIKGAEGAATAQDQAQFTAREDWRVRLALSPGANFLYKAKNPGILQPLSPNKGTDGVIFPYTPTITVNYAANYEPTSITHSNYKIYQYQNSSVDQVQITCEFTAQDVKEANYVLAVIHFFRSMTKMFYGQDSNPKNGTPPPLCYLYGMGGYQFDALPLVISGFNYALPQDVDYIKTMAPSAAGTTQPSVDNGASSPGRLGGKIGAGGKAAKPNYGTSPTQSGESPTWVPTKINISVTCLPIMSRNQISNYFSLTEYATGKLLQGTRQGRLGGGMW